MQPTALVRNGDRSMKTKVEIQSFPPIGDEAANGWGTEICEELRLWGRGPKGFVDEVDDALAAVEAVPGFWRRAAEDAGG